MSYRGVLILNSSGFIVLTLVLRDDIEYHSLLKDVERVGL